MRFSKLGRTGLDCSRLGFGTWQIGGGRWKGLERTEAVALLHHARDVGVNIFDAAVVYGQYRNTLGEIQSHSLALLGEAFEGCRDQVIICLKLGQLDEYSHRAIYEPRAMVDEMRRSLRELRTDYVDLCLVHAPSLEEVRNQRALCVVKTLQATGAARFVGYSFEAEADHARLALGQGVDVIMFQYNLIDSDCEGVFSLAEEQGVGVVVGGPYKRGYLSGQFESVADLPLDDNYWAWNLRYSRSKVEATLKQAVALRKEAGGAPQLRQRALQHILRHRGAATAIVGHRAGREVTENAMWIDGIEGG